MFTVYGAVFAIGWFGCSEIDVPFNETDTTLDNEIEGNRGSCTVDDDCNDLNPCTANRCNNGQCLFPPAQAICVIDDMCVEAGAINPSDECLICYPEKDENGWSGRICDDGNPATKDSCGSAVGCLFEPFTECPEGHAQPDCLECLNGWQDNDEDGSCQPTCQAAELECGLDGECDDSSGIATCACGPEYLEPHCDTCAVGFQDNDSNGSCEPTCAKAEVSCVDNSSCDDSSGTPICVCDEGLAGEFCDGCTDGLQDKDGDGICKPACQLDASECGLFGVCNDSTGQIVCDCDEGHTGESCDTCAPFFQDNDGDEACFPGCEHPTVSCGAGTCEDASGAVVCSCTEGWEGETCDVCAPGYTSIAGDCALACNPADCGKHEVCDDSNACACAPGFQSSLGGCVWKGVGLKETLQQEDVSAWTLTGSAKLENESLHFPLGCEWASASTTVEMPNYEDAVPLAVQLNLKSQKTGFCGFNGCINLPVFMSINGHTKNFQHDDIGDTPGDGPAADGGEKVTFCLPPTGYGGAVDITFFNGPPLGQFADLFCDTAKFATWSIASIELIQVSEDECPTAGTIGDHAFDKQDLSWTLTSENPDSSAFMANNELVLKTYTPCVKASASQTVMAPGPAQGADKALALLFDLKASKNAKLQITAGELNLRRIQGEGENLVLTETICLSKPFVASNIPLKFELGSCAEDNKTTALIDNVRFEYVASCNHQKHLVDGGFESAAQGIRTWGHYGFENTVTIQQVKVNTGLAAAQIRANSPCFENGIFAWFNVPPATSEAGPALSFAYLFPSGQSNAIPQITVGEQYGPYQLLNSNLGFKQQNVSEAVKPSDSWKKQTLCLDPHGGGRRARLKFGLFGGAGVCNAVYDSEELWIDDVSVALDPNCPGL